MKIICLGDSLTFGNVGYSYIHFLDKKANYQYINKGKNGDTLKGAYDRLTKIIMNSKYESEIYILGIGTNDILLPYLKSVSPFWFISMSLRCKLMRCIEDDEQFYQEYDKILDLFQKQNKRVVVFGMPFINLRDFPQVRLIKRNKLIEELSQKHHYPFIDVYKLQHEKIRKNPRIYTWKYRFLVRMIDAVIMTIFPFTKDYFSRFRGLTMSVDGAHFNSASAKVLAEEVIKQVISQTTSI